VDAGPTTAHTPTRRRDRAALVATLLVVAAACGLLMNPYWSRGGDSEVYLSLARNLLTGHGYTFNGNSAAMIRPLWPALLAATMWLSPTFLAVKLLTAACLWGWAACNYALVRRWLGPWASAGVTIAVALLVPATALAYRPFSDPLFLLLTSASLVAAYAIADRGVSGRRVALLATLCAAASLTRPATLATFPLVAAAVWAGRAPRWREGGPHPNSLPGCRERELAPPMSRTPFRDPYLLTVAFVGVVTLAAFLAWPLAMRVAPERVDPRYDALLTGHYALFNPPAGETLEEILSGYEDRVVRLGRYAAGLFVDPWARSGWPMYAVNPFGWAGLVVFGWFGVRAARRGEWVWLATLLFVAAISLNWPNPAQRYLLPVAPLLATGLVLSLSQATALLRWRGGRAVVRVALMGGAALVVAYNAAVWVHEVTIARSGEAYPDRYEGGTTANLPAVAHWLVEQAPKRYEIAASQVSGNRKLLTQGAMRSLHFLTGRPIVLGPERVADPPDRDLARWADPRNVRYFVYQPPVKLVFHTSYPTTRAVADATPSTAPATQPSDDAPDVTDPLDWQIYLVRDGKVRRIDAAGESRAITRIPGLGGDRLGRNDQ
jgi:hypothetical protein